MNISALAQIVSSALDGMRNFLAPIPSTLLLCTCNRRPGLSAIATAAKIYSDMHQNEFDDIVKKFVYNVVDKIKRNIQDDGVCFVIIPPGEMKFTLMGANAGGPIILNESPSATSTPSPLSNTGFVFAYAIIR